MCEGVYFVVSKIRGPPDLTEREGAARVSSEEKGCLRNAHLTRWPVIICDKEKNTLIKYLEIQKMTLNIRTSLLAKKFARWSTETKSTCLRSRAQPRIVV